MAVPAEVVAVRRVVTVEAPDAAPRCDGADLSAAQQANGRTVRWLAVVACRLRRARFWLLAGHGLATALDTGTAMLP